jgi:RNA polymerase sigma-70 factor (ECF subfamily)
MPWLPGKEDGDILPQGHVAKQSKHLGDRGSMYSKTCGDGGGVGEQSDEVLVEKVRAGDLPAYGELVERYQAAILRRAQSILRDPSAAEDAAQEAFVRAYSYLHTYDDQHRLYTWLARIVTNVCLSHLSSHQWQTLPLETALLIPSETLEDDDPELAALTDERSQVLQAAIAGLPAKYREVLILRYWQDLAYDEIAAMTAQSLGAVKTQLRRARLLLGDQLRGQAASYEWGFQR